MILGALARRWEQDPDLRLGQLLSQLADGHDLRLVEDGELLRRLGPANAAEQEYVDREPGVRRSGWRKWARAFKPGSGRSGT